jgi:hypothetical protein
MGSADGTRLTAMGSADYRCVRGEQAMLLKPPRSLLCRPGNTQHGRRQLSCLAHGEWRSAQRVVAQLLLVTGGRVVSDSDRMILIFSRDPCSYCEDGCEVERADDDVVSGQPGRPAASTGPTRQLLALLSLPRLHFGQKDILDGWP